MSKHERTSCSREVFRGRAPIGSCLLPYLCAATQARFGTRVSGEAPVNRSHEDVGPLMLLHERRSTLRERSVGVVSPARWAAL